MKALWLLLLTSTVWAAPDNVVRLEGISIQGNSEEPQVIYITPWQEPAGTRALYQGPYSDKTPWLHALDPERLAHEMAQSQSLRKPSAESKPTQDKTTD